ncbi:MAG TPA: hypothetical protein DEF45_01355 [Rhodopirellula sp.]|nr:hypothetical protein [Rhodopirellula sp.]
MSIDRILPETDFLGFGLLKLPDFGHFSDSAGISVKDFLQVSDRFGLARQTHRVSVRAAFPPHCRSVNPHLLIGREYPSPADQR